ncbi:Bro-N domain-containing protein [Citrobacter freundii]|uniref:Bro-N domain-containing protein n=1 Tax=Citrobacter freundii TaxID=546 RepID=UPI0028792B50|nr:BRO-like protein [Salmonella enterica]
MTSKNIPSVFKFESVSAIRAVMLDGAPWFVASDVIKALQLTNATMSMKALDDDERSKLNLGRQGTANIISESGLYTLILRCRDAVTPGTIPYRFRKWVTGEVLPQIRRTGRYVREELSPADKAQKVVASFMPAILEAMKTGEKQEYSAPLKPNYLEHIHSPEGVLGLTERSMLMDLLRKMDADGHNVEGAFSEVTAMMNYIVGASKCLRDIQTHAQYINSMAGKF